MSAGHLRDDEEGNARIARIVDYLILIDGDLQHITRGFFEQLRGRIQPSVRPRRRHSTQPAISMALHTQKKPLRPR